MKKFVTSIILFVLLLSLSTSTYAHDGHAPFGTTSHEHKVTSIQEMGNKSYAVGGPNIGGSERPEGLVLVRYNDTNETINGVIYKVVQWQNNYKTEPTIPFPDSEIGAAMSASYSDFTLNQLGYKWIRHEYEIPAGKTLVVTMHNEYKILRVNLRNKYTYDPQYTIFGEFTTTSFGHADVKKYIGTRVNEYLLDGQYDAEDILNDPSIIFSNSND